MINLAVTGITGRMGRTILDAISLDNQQFNLVAAVHKNESAYLGQDVCVLTGGAESGVTIVDRLPIDGVDVLIEFTLPDTTIHHLRLAKDAGVAAVVGTTGFNESQLQELEALSESIPIVFAPNMSVGVNLSLHLLEEVAKVIKGKADIDIIETHHRNKLDAPSGTALAMGASIASQLGVPLEECARYGFQSNGQIRNGNDIGFHSVRGGDVIGDHTAVFALAGERIEISHKASNRTIYAEGALRAASWLCNKEPGLYSMKHVLGLGTSCR